MPSSSEAAAFRRRLGGNISRQVKKTVVEIERELGVLWFESQNERAVYKDSWDRYHRGDITLPEELHRMRDRNAELEEQVALLKHELGPRCYRAYVRRNSTQENEILELKSEKQALEGTVRDLKEELKQAVAKAEVEADAKTAVRVSEEESGWRYVQKRIRIQGLEKRVKELAEELELVKRETERRQWRGAKQQGQQGQQQSSSRVQDKTDSSELLRHMKRVRSKLIPEFHLTTQSEQTLKERQRASSQAEMENVVSVVEVLKHEAEDLNAIFYSLDDGSQLQKSVRYSPDEYRGW